MKCIINMLLFSFLLISCKDIKDQHYEIDEENNIDESIYNGNLEIDNEQVSDYSDGTYCAGVTYYNSSTGTNSTYSLNVEVENGELIVIYWPSGGWLDDSHFYPEDISDGDCEFTSDKGYEYTVVLGDFGGCGYTDEFKIQNDVEDDAEETCLNCGGYKFNSFDDYCDDCKDKLDEY